MIIEKSPEWNIDKDIERKKELLKQIKKSHFKSVGYQVVDSDTMIFLISELTRFYFPSE